MLVNELTDVQYASAKINVKRAECIAEMMQFNTVNMRSPNEGVIATG